MERCISYLTQKKGALTLEEMKKIGQNIYGCEICQKVCPKNLRPKGVISSEDKFLLMEEILAMSNRQFQKRFAHTAAGWRGKKILQRNAICALGNSKTKQSLTLLQKCLEDQRQEIRLTAARAIFNTKFSEKWDMLEKAYEAEEEQDIKDEIQFLLEKRGE